MDKSLSREFLQVMNEMRKLTGKHYSGSALHPGEFMMLYSIHTYMTNNEKNSIDIQGVKVGELSELIHSTKSATSKMLKTVEDKGFIERVFDKKDRRVVLVKLSQEGEAIIKETMNSMREFTLNTIEKLGEEDTRELIRIMKNFNQAMIEVLQEEERSL